MTVIEIERANAPGRRRRARATRDAVGVQQGRKTLLEGNLYASGQPSRRGGVEREVSAGGTPRLVILSRVVEVARPGMRRAVAPGKPLVALGKWRGRLVHNRLIERVDGFGADHRVVRGNAIVRLEGDHRIGSFLPERPICAEAW